MSTLGPKGPLWVSWVWQTFLIKVSLVFVVMTCIINGRSKYEKNPSWSECWKVTCDLNVAALIHLPKVVKQTVLGCPVTNECTCCGYRPILNKLSTLTFISKQQFQFFLSDLTTCTDKCRWLLSKTKSLPFMASAAVCPFLAYIRINRNCNKIVIADLLKTINMLPFAKWAWLQNCTKLSLSRIVD